MKCKVRLSYAVEMFVEGESEEEIMDWLCATTPQEARDSTFNPVDEEYDEEIICYVDDDSDVDYVIGEKYI